MKKRLYKIIIGSIFLVSSSCINDSENKENKLSMEPKQVFVNKSIQNLNISLLLDLSDRIDPQKYPNESMDYYIRDVAYIRSVSEAFNNHLRAKKVRQMNDKIQLYFSPEPQNQNINKISSDLRYNVSSNNISLELINELKERYSSQPKEIYDLAIEDNRYIGSDTWRFFKTKVKDYCIEENYRNILVILTDGYIYHKDNKIRDANLTSYLTPQEIRHSKLNNKDWEDKIVNEKLGFIPAIDDLSNLEILVLGINPDKKNPYEEDVIFKYWKDWFNNMKVNRYEIKTAGLPSNMDKIIKDFILNN